MGTSGSYSAPPSWGKLKGQVTRSASGGHLSRTSASRLMKGFVSYNGGASRIARHSGGGGVVAKGRAAQGVARRLAGFVSDVGELGFENATKKAGWSDLVGRPINEVISALLDRLSGDSNTLDDVDARMALSTLQDEYFSSATTTEELGELIIAQTARLELFLLDFFGHYLYEVFCRVFFERLVQRVGEMKAYSFLADIRDFIRSTLSNRTAVRNLSDIDWDGVSGQTMIQEIMETTLTVFGG